MRVEKKRELIADKYEDMTFKNTLCINGYLNGLLKSHRAKMNIKKQPVRTVISSTVTGYLKHNKT